MVQELEFWAQALAVAPPLMVVVADEGEPTATPPEGADRPTVKAREPEKGLALLMATVKLLGLASPSAQLSMPPAEV